MLLGYLGKPVSLAGAHTTDIVALARQVVPLDHVDPGVVALRWFLFVR